MAHKKNIAITNWILKDSVATSKRIRMSQTNKIAQKQALQWFVIINNAVWLPEMKVYY